MLFIRRTKIPNLSQPILSGQRLKLYSKAKYLGVILDLKLSWKLNIEEPVRKACIPYYSCRKTFSNTWGLHPKITLWMYPAVVRPILTY